MELNSEKGAVIKYTNVPVAQTVVQFCELKGIRNIVICAGSRNAPLTNGFVENPFFKTFSIVDERAAAFFSLGMAQQLKAPTVVVCTSGSALLNFYPAVAEAHYSDIPLVIISADLHANGILEKSPLKNVSLFLKPPSHQKSIEFRVVKF